MHPPQPFGPQGPLVRQICRACNNVCFVPENEPIPDQGYRCTACNEANYERRNFDKTLPPEKAILETPEWSSKIEPGFVPPTEVQQPAEDATKSADEAQDRVAA